MKISVSIHREGPGFVANSVVPECSGEGATCELALDDLRRGLADRLAPESIAPPEGDHAPAIELVIEEQ